MTTNIVIAGITSFFFGSCIGSFFKLVIDRYGTENSFVFKPSFCLNCKNKLNWWQNIPIISYLLLRGKCFFCKTSIDPTCFYWEMFIAMITLGKKIAEALLYAPINSMSVVQKVGAQEGLLTRAELEAWLKKAPAEYKIQNI